MGWRHDEQGPWGGGATRMARGAVARHAGPAGWQRDEQGPWGGGVMCRAVGRPRYEQGPWGGGA
jgi:hypothetical protein